MSWYWILFLAVAAGLVGAVVGIVYVFDILAFFERVGRKLKGEDR